MKEWYCMVRDELRDLPCPEMDERHAECFLLADLMDEAGELLGETT